MPALSVSPPFPIFTDTDGQPLENGYVWIGTANLNPITNPVAVFWDAALTAPAGQPIRTLNGYPSNAGTPARLYVNSDYSIQVQNKNGSVVYGAPSDDSQPTYTTNGIAYAVSATELTTNNSLTFNGTNLGIGTNLPGAKLDVSGAGSTYVQVRSSNALTGSGYFTNNATRSWLIGAGAGSGSSNLEFRDVTGAATRMSIDTSGNLLLGTFTVNARLTVSGSVLWTTGASFAGTAGNAVWSTGFGSQAINASIQASDSIAGASIYAISDVRLKSNIKPIPSGLAFVNEVDAVQFTWKESGIEDTGFIAQDLLKKGFGHLVSAIPDGAMKELVHDDGNVSPAGSRFVVKYDSVVPILCKAIQEQQALITSLTARVAALEQA
jgi:hypothetical protein